MKITRVRIYRVTMPTTGGGFRRTTGFSPAENTSAIVLVDTDEGITGAGEVCPLGRHYMPGVFTEGAFAGLPVLAGMVLGADPFQTEKINREWDISFNGQNYIKTAIDMALWDIMGQATGRPVCELLGGRWEKPVPLYRSVHLFAEHEDTPEMWAKRCIDYRHQGYRHFQLKCGSEPDHDIAKAQACCAILEPGEKVLMDANCGWTLHGAIRVAQGCRDLPVIIEQPCLTWEENIAFRRHCALPVKLDESLHTTQDILRGFNEGAMDICCLKISRVGGLTKARRIRDLCVDLGLQVTADDMWGSEIVTAALAHFATSTPTKYVLNTTDLTDYVTTRTATGCPERQDGCITASTAPGLGVTPDMDVLGEPVAVVE